MVWALCLSLPFGVLAQVPFRLSNPDYDCATGAITFKTTGGNGSPITYTAPGVTRSSPTSNTGVVEQGLRNDPKSLTITATQNGETVSTTFNFALYCNTRQSSPLYKTVDNRTLPVGQFVLGYPDFVVGQGYYASYDYYNYTKWPISATGLPPGLGLYTSVMSGTLFAVGIAGSPTTPGVYPVRVTAVDPKFPNDPPYVTTFTITVTDPSVVNPPIKPPVLAKSIPDMTFTVGQVPKQEDFNLGNYIVDPTQSQPRYFPEWTASIKGLPAGIRQNTFGDLRYNLSVSLTGAPTVSGVYTVTATAATQYFASQPVTTTFNITVTDKPVNPPTSGALALTQPTYDCGTGAITFNTTGGDGSPITYSAPGITRSSPTSNTGVVEQGLRNDPKPITITATQSGQTVSYTFDFKAYCSNVTPILPPVVDGAIPAMVVRTNSGRAVEPFVVSQYFRDPTQPFGTYKSNLRFSIAGSSGQLLTTLPQGLFLKDLSAEQSAYAFIAGSTTQPGTYTVTVTATNLNLPAPANSTSAPLIIQVIDKPAFNADGALELTQPDYNCQTGVVGFRLVNRATTDVSPITYTAPDVTLTSATSSTGVVNADVQNNPRPITIQATQSGRTVSYVFDLKAYTAAYCSTPTPPNPPTGGTLTLLAPTYDCGTGAIHFNAGGGNGSPVEFKAVGITDWTINPDQFVDRDSRTANDVKPFTLMARQSGYETTYTWDLKAACGRARVGVQESGSILSLTVLGNPVQEQLRVRIDGAEGQAVNVQLMDQTGRLLESRAIERAGRSEEQTFKLSQQNGGLLLLRAATSTQTSTVKISKQ
ncbi:hypothetical protein GCM10028825_26970 [Spirosoma agri]